MKIVHNIALTVDDQEKLDFSAVGVELRSGFTSFQIEEEDPRWENVALLVKKFKAVDTVTTMFSDSELNGAKFLGAVPSWHHGYPEPADNFGYLNATFNLTDYCKECGIGKKQSAPFRMKMAPAWGNKSILQLNWIFDEFFVKPDIWEQIFRPLGISNVPVLQEGTGIEIDSVVQLNIPLIFDLDLNNVNYEDCSCCGRRKYLPVSRGFYPSPISASGAIFKSNQYFGSGASAHRMVLVSNALHSLIKEAGLKGVDFKPCTD